MENTQRELIVSLKHPNKFASLFFSFCAYTFFTFLALFIELSFFGPIISICLKIICGAAAAIFFIGFFNTIDLIRTGDTHCIFRVDGVWIKSFSFIPWSSILELGDYPAIKGRKFPRTFGIRFKNPQAISAQAGWQGKMQIFWSKFIDRPHVQLVELSVLPREIIHFCEQYVDAEKIKKNESKHNFYQPNPQLKKDIRMNTLQYYLKHVHDWFLHKSQYGIFMYFCLWIVQKIMAFSHVYIYDVKSFDFFMTFLFWFYIFAPFVRSTSSLYPDPWENREKSV